jgi:3-deoxy-D-manno-octulosonic-acid transferase
LTKIYSYADVAYVGGGFATGLHNTLEPAIFSIPVIIGPKYLGFAEAEELVQRQGILSINSPSEFRKKMNLCFESVDYKQKTGEINHSYIASKKGASRRILNVINSKIKS